MKKISMALALLAATQGAVTTAYAANGGTVNFTGALTRTSCEVSSGGGTADNIPVDLGRVSFADIGRRTESKLQTAKDIILLVSCLEAAAEQFMEMSFQPLLTDVDDPYLLATSGAAQGVGIGLLHFLTDAFINLSDPADTIIGVLEPSGTGSRGELKMKAVYTLNGKAPVAGAATGSLPFRVSYH